MAIIYLCTADPGRGSAEEQERACRDYATKWGLPVSRRFHDTTPLGSGFTELLEAVKDDGEPDVIISEITVIGRSITRYFGAETRLDRAGACLRPAREGYRPSIQTLCRAVAYAVREHNGPCISAARRKSA